MKKRYSGKLADPIVVKLSPANLYEYSTWDPEDQAQSRDATVWVEFNEKIPLLFEHFGIVRTGTIADFWHLAITHVPGFQTVDPALKRKGGRRKRWTVERQTELIADVEAVKREKHYLDSGACRVLSTSSRYRDRWSDLEQRTLQNQLLIAKKSNKNLVWRMVEQAGDDEEKEYLISVIINHFGIPKNKK